MRLGQIVLLVRDYDEAKDWFVEKLSFSPTEDVKLSEEKRWVVVSPPGEGGADLLLAKAKNEDEVSRIGDQTGGRVFLFLYTNDFDRDYGAMKDKSVEFVETPRNEEYGKVVVFKDLYGNKWDLVERQEQK